MGCLVTLALVALHLWLRWPALYNPHFHNEDTAGITYSASLILNGGVPLRDTVEMKAPGAFFVLAGWWSLFEPTLINAQRLMALWAALAALGVGLGAWCLTYCVRASLLSALCYVLFAPYTDSVDINYGAWMITPYIWSVALLIYATRDGALRLWAWLLAGLLMTAAALCKRQGAALAPLFVLAAYVPYQRRGVRAALSALLAALGGCLLGFLPMLEWYRARGALEQWVSSYLLSQSGWEYVRGGGSASSGAAIWPRLGDGLLGLWEYSQAPLSLALCATVFLMLSARFGPKLAREHDAHRLLFLWALTALSYVGASLGWRYFKGYYLQLLPGLLWIGALLFERRELSWVAPRLRRVALGCCLLLLLGPSLRDVQRSLEARARRARPLYLPTYEVQRVSAWIRAQRRPEDTLWVWGRWGWPLYHHTGLMSPTRYYKSLGVLTTQLTNTWNPRRRSEPVRFNPESAWPEAIEELRASPPRFIVLARNEDWRGFKELRALLDERYQRVSPSALKLHRPRQELFKVYQRR